MIRIALLAALLSSTAFAKPLPPTGQGRACDAKNKCEPGLECVPRAGGKTHCELVCDNRRKCPDDQRCVKDGPHLVCRDINDGVGGL